MRLLAIETATEACSAALWIDGAVRTRFEIAPRRHAELILPMCDSLMNEAGIAPPQLDVVAFGRGPGAFTGVRIAVGIAQGIAFASGLPVVCVSTLAAIAQEVISQTYSTRVLAAIDARMGEIYWGYYEKDNGGCVRRIGEERVGRPDRIENPSVPGWFGAGSGWSAYRDILIARLGHCVHGFDADRLPRAEYVARLAVVAHRAGLAISPDRAQPIYLRDEVAKKTCQL
jgi:tRNA threonylcarbamoyladenosine biosynthesis protein TsaB